MKSGRGKQSRSNIYLACVSSSVVSGTITTSQSDWLSCWVYPWRFVASSSPTYLSSSGGVVLVLGRTPTSCTLTLTSWTLVLLSVELL